MTSASAPIARFRTALLGWALAALGGLVGCASTASYPSLAPRAAEGSAQAGAAVAAPPFLPADAALDGRVAALAAQAASGHAVFERAATQACAATARGAKAAQGSEQWIAAQQAISSLDAARGPVQSAVAELDRLVIERGTAGGPTVDLSRLAAAQEQASALDSAEQAMVARQSAGSCGG
jgi:hypothetical protein